MFVLTAFFLSGAGGLVYEVLWTRYLANLIGSTSLSQVVVLMVFMGGLAIGAPLFGRLSDRSDNGLLIYGLLELGIGLYAFIFSWLFRLADGLFVSLAAHVEPGTLAMLVVKFCTAASLITVPAVLMGGTLPVITRFLTRSHKLLRQNISMLYGLNSLGAVLGVLAGGFYLVHHYGMSRSMVMTSAGNMLLGAAALGLALFLRRRPELLLAGPAQHFRRQGEKLDAQLYRREAVRRAIVAAGVSGFAAMALQICWIRYFAIVLGATHSAFTIVVAAFIFGIGLGSLLVSSRPAGRFPMPTLLTLAFTLTSLSMGLGLFFYARVPFEIGRAMAVFAPVPLAWPVYETMRFAICFVLMLLPTMAAGMIFPICVRIVSRSDRLGRDVALVYAVNTIGALLGVLLTSQVLFRLFNLPQTLQFIFGIYLLMTFSLIFLLRAKGRKRLYFVAVVLAVVHLSFWRPWDPQNLYISRVQFGQNPPFKYSEFLRDIRKLRLIDEFQGPDVHVAVIDDHEDPDNVYRTMFIDGKPDASNDRHGPDLVTETLSAHLPMLLHPAPENVFILGLGSGITTAEVLKYPSVREVVTAELAAEVFTASRKFAVDNGSFWKNPKHRMVIEDGKTFLMVSRQKFDVIAMEPTNVWQEGMAGLFSEEFFRLVRSRLTDNGVVAQWLHTYRTDNQTINIIMKTFSMVFPDASVFEMGAGDMLLVAYNDGWSFDPMKMEHRFYRPAIQEALKRVGVDSPAALLLREVLAGDGFREYTALLPVSVNTLDFPVLEQAAEFGWFLHGKVSVLSQMDSRLDPDHRGLRIHKYVERIGLDGRQLLNLAASEAMADKDQLRNSLALMAISRQNKFLKAEDQDALRRLLSEPMLREVLAHPLYGADPAGLKIEDVFQMLGGELLLWRHAASQLWTPDPQRLRRFYDRLAALSADADAGMIALGIGLPLAQRHACTEALPYFRLADERGAVAKMVAEQPSLLLNILDCEVKAGEVARAAEVWHEVGRLGLDEEYDLSFIKALLDMRTSGRPPPPVYERMPTLW